MKFIFIHSLKDRLHKWFGQIPKIATWNYLSLICRLEKKLNLMNTQVPKLEFKGKSPY